MLIGAQLQGASLQRANLHLTNLSEAILWRTDFGAPSTGDAAIVADVMLANSPYRWRPGRFGWPLDLDTAHPWNDKAYQYLRKMMESVLPGGLRDPAMNRIQLLDCANPDRTLASCDASVPPPPQAAAWKKSLEDARVDDAAYAKALAAELKTEVCSADKDAADVLRGLMKNGRLAAAGPEAPPLVDFILSKDCPVSKLVTDADRAKLLQIKREVEAAKKPGG